MYFPGASLAFPNLQWIPNFLDLLSSANIIDKNTKVVFLIHGGKRAAEQTIQTWLPLSSGRNVALIAPKFSKEFYNEYAYLMKTNKNGKLLSDQSNDLDESLGLLFDFFSIKFNLTNPSFRIYGHSGGSQFVHRYLLLSQETRIDKAAMANAGFYTFLNDRIGFPFGIKGMGVSEERLRWVFSLKGAILLGSQDSDSKHPGLPSMRKARKQGKHRLERGTNFFDDLVSIGSNKRMPFRWRYQVVAGVAHNNQGMSKAAAEFILEDL